MPGTEELGEKLCYYRQALAIDERRGRFQPEYVRGGKSVEQGPDNLDKSGVPRFLEVWFVGLHSDV